ncbi:MAG: hypothetical protein M1832_005921 [Thelocarpon impressellum]|nr:MAG: hypothetical protein M1832_005921 [Thelocarpon impressellum]
MFHRRRAASNPALNAPPSASATTAAAQAFLANRASNASLSSAAAAAALRSHTTSPVPMAQVQTKRIIRRQNSGTSSASGGAGSVRGSGGQRLQRQNSSGSMTERTFRDPSPNRVPARAPADDAPPVPALPDVPPLPPGAHRRATSLQPPARITSPAPATTAGRPLSLDRGPAVSPGLIAAQRVAGLASVQEQQQERTDGAGSVNFSRPNIVRTPPPTNRGPGSSFSASPHQIDDPSPATSTASTPVKKKKKKVVARSTEPGSSTSDQVVLNRTQGPALLPPKSTAVVSPGLSQPRNAVSTQAYKGPGVAAAPPAAATKKKKKKKQVPAQGAPAPQSPPGLSTYMDQATTYYNSDLDSIPESGYDSAPDPPRMSTTRPSGSALGKRPSIVREDREREEQEDMSLADVNGRPSSAAAAYRTPRSKASPRVDGNATEIRSTKRVAAAGDSKQFAAARQHGRSSSQPDAPIVGPSSNSEVASGLGRGKESMGGRPQSMGSSRVAHFGVSPPLTSPNITKHHPPPRSLSPAKSAMKNSPSPRGGSPADQASRAREGGSLRAPSEASDMSIVSDAETPSRRKSTRVSFDEQPVVLDTGANAPVSPISSDMLSPQHKHYPRPSNAEADDAQEDILQPRPALPSFGSVRNRKERDGGDEQAGNAPRHSPPASPVVFTSITGERIAISNDDAVGTVIQRDFAARIVGGGPSTVKGSADTRGESEPLPPQVTSVEGSGDESETEGSVYSNRGTETGPSDAPAVTRVAEGVASVGGPVPEIAIVQPTPIQERQEPILQAPDGSFEGAPDPNIAHQSTIPTPASVGIAEPEPEELAINHGPVVLDGPEALRVQTDLPSSEDSDDTDESLYDDAAEAFAEPQGDGFMSLDAVVESPVVDKTPGLAITTPPDTPISRVAKDKAYVRSGLSRIDSEGSEPAAEDGWHRAQEYWSSLSDGRKKEIEEAALPESNEETSPAPKAKAKGKKKKALAPVQPGTTTPVATTRAAQPIARQGEVGGSQPTDVRAQYATTAVPSPPMKSSLRSKQNGVAAEMHMAKSMRDGSTAKARRETRAVAPVSKSPPVPVDSRPPKSALKKPRPVSAPLLENNPALAAAVNEQLRKMPGTAAAATNAVTSVKPTKTGPSKTTPLRRTGSDASGSSASASSFIKSRPKATTDNGFFMRRTMRGSSQPIEASGSRRPGSSDGPAAQNRRSSMRSSSPSRSPSRRAFSGSTPASALGKGTMRGSMRISTASDTPSLPSKTKDRTKSPSRFSAAFGRTSKSKQGAAKASRPLSRFTDSSDEDEVRPTFRSRFSDSSDDGPSTLSTDFTPVRGIPRRIGEEDGESTDLPDSSEGETPTMPKAASAPKVSPQVGSALASASLRSDSGKAPEGSAALLATTPTGKEKKKKRSFFSVLGRRKDSSRVRKADGESGARIDTPLERSNAEIKSVRETALATMESPATDTPPSPAAPANGVRPKLVKKATARSIGSGHWPLPPNLGNVPRPATSDGRVGGPRTERPEIGNRRVTATDFPNGGVAVAEKKKKFPRLRRAFGLHD